MILTAILGLTIVIGIIIKYFNEINITRRGIYILGIINLAVAIYLYNIYKLTPKWIELSVMLVLLSILSIIDLKSRIIPNGIIAGIFLFGVLFNLINTTVTIKDMLLGFLVISIPLLIFSMIIKESIGGGDIKLMAAAGAAVGFGNIIVGFFISSIISFIILVTLILLKKIKSTDFVPYGPFLSIGIFIATLLV